MNIAITAANKGWFDNSIEWLQQALSKGKLFSKKLIKPFWTCLPSLAIIQLFCQKGNYIYDLNGFLKIPHFLDNIKKRDSKEDIKRAKYTLKQIKSTHDAWLNKSGPVSKIHRTFAIPFDSKLRKKKKFKKVTSKGTVRGPENFKKVHAKKLVKWKESISRNYSFRYSYFPIFWK